MTSEIFAVMVTSATAGAVLGVIIKHLMDNKWIKEVNSIWEEHLGEVYQAEHEHQKRLEDIIKRQDDTIGRLYNKLTASRMVAQQAQAQQKRTRFQDYTKFFEGLINEPLPEGFDGLDFPGSTKEGK